MDQSSIKRKIMTYKDEVDDYDMYCWKYIFLYNMFYIYIIHLSKYQDLNKSKEELIFIIEINVKQ